jgi:tetratricopeptide (TPR) repeat protein
MEVEEAQDLFQRLRVSCETVIISIPLGHYPQGEYDGNPHEKHVTDNWSAEEVIGAFGKPTYWVQDGNIGIFAYSDHDIRLKICVYAISKNEEQFVDRFCQSSRDADLILIADTGSTDATADRSREQGATVHEISISPWRFDLARNAALALIPRHFDVCISLDLDEVLEEGWREEIERVWIAGKTTRLRYFFDWGCGIKFKYEKIHAKHGYMWHHPCHEYPIHDGRIQEVWADTDMLLAVHKPDPTKSRGQYLDLLRISVEEDPHCPRNAFYYARELSFHRHWEQSIAECNRYLGLRKADWPNERCYAYRVMGRCYNELGNVVEAERAFQKASFEAPNTREPWCELAMLYYQQHRWPECYAAANRALQIVNRQFVYTVDPAVWGAQPHDLASISAWHMGLRDVALEQARIAVEKEPDDERLQNNLRFIEGSFQSLDQEAA